MSLYYKIWTDYIYKAQTIPSYGHDWKWKTLIYMSTCMGILFAILMAFFQKIIGASFYFLNIDIFPGDNIDAFLSGFILFVLPFLIINYILIFRGGRYKLLMNKYPHSNGKFFKLFFSIALGIPIIGGIIIFIVKTFE